MILWQQYLNLITNKRDDGGRGVKNYQKLRDVIYGRPQRFQEILKVQQITCLELLRSKELLDDGTQLSA
jgi:hypothetical protein